MQVNFRFLFFCHVIDCILAFFLMELIYLGIMNLHYEQMNKKWNCFL